MNGAKMKIRIGRPSCDGVFASRHRAAARFPDPLAASDRALSDASGDFRPEPSEPSGQRQGNQKGRGRQDPGNGQRESQRRGDVAVGDGGGEFARADETPHHRIEQHDQRDEQSVTAPGLQPAKIRVPADELIGHPDKGGPKKITLRPIQHEARRHPLDQVRQHVSRHDGDQRGIAEQHDAQQDGQVFQRLKRLCARDQHNERPDVAGRDDQYAGQRDAEERLRVPPLPRTAESPVLPDPEGETAKCADRHQEADEIAEPPPHLEHREGDAVDERLQPCDGGGHGRSRGVATAARRCRMSMATAQRSAAAPLGTPGKPCRVMPDPAVRTHIVSSETTPPWRDSITSGAPCRGRRTARSPARAWTGTRSHPWCRSAGGLRHPAAR